MFWAFNYCSKNLVSKQFQFQWIKHALTYKQCTNINKVRSTVWHLLGSTTYLSLAYFSRIAGCGSDSASENNAHKSQRHGIRLQDMYPVTADSLSHCNNDNNVYFTLLLISATTQYIHVQWWADKKNCCVGISPLVSVLTDWVAKTIEALSSKLSYIICYRVHTEQWFSMTFQDCLIKWLSKKSDFHIYSLSAAIGSGGALKLPSPSGSGQNRHTVKNVATIWLILHAFPEARPDSMILQAWKIWILNSMYLIKWGVWGDGVGVGVESCKIMFLVGTSYSLFLHFCCKMYLLATMYSITDGWTDAVRRTTVWCQRPITPCVVRWAKKLQ